ncbi:hypothetical protein BN996_03365 [Haloferax massiliensis]|uniref:Uncharacterized protein n=1 Tax=Haloferax massiliensis TaxID=1476858 RepID=A0A0D6JVC2_9EURY|nr:hypothetical protein BN996_03365 [Haloferax massiliensis]
MCHRIEVLEPPLCGPGPEGADIVTIHNNTFEQSSFVYGSPGAVNNDDATLNATNDSSNSGEGCRHWES